VVISGNNFFESPKESILADRPRHMIISDNNFAVVGQKVISSAIKLTNSDTKISSEMNIIIDGNIIDGTSDHGIHVDVNMVRIKIKDNVLSRIGNTAWKGTGSQNTGAWDIVVDDGDLLSTDSNGIKYKNDVILDGNSGEKGVINNRGMLMNHYWLAQLDTNNTFGSMKFGSVFSGVVDFKAIKLNTTTNVSNTPYNPGFPFLLKSVTGTISNIINAGINQIIWIVAGSTGLTITHGSGMINKSGTNLTLTNGQTALYMCSDNNWYQLA
jgi:hypothetical protein